MCQRGRGVVQQLFEQFDHERLRGIIVWLSMLTGDNVDAAHAQAKLVQDRRVVKVWDAERRTAELFAQMLVLSCPAWDVYLLYPTGVRWDAAEPPRPAFWMHQLPEAVGAESGLPLKPDRLAEELRWLLEA